MPRTEPWRPPVAEQDEPRWEQGCPCMLLLKLREVDPSLLRFSSSLRRGPRVSESETRARLLSYYTA
eukprot:3941409-Rhodomonas_salina.2